MTADWGPCRSKRTKNKQHRAHPISPIADSSTQAQVTLLSGRDSLSCPELGWGQEDCTVDPFTILMLFRGCFEGCGRFPLDGNGRGIKWTTCTHHIAIGTNLIDLSSGRHPQRASYGDEYAELATGCLDGVPPDMSRSRFRLNGKGPRSSLIVWN